MCTSLISNIRNFDLSDTHHRQEIYHTGRNYSLYYENIVHVFFLNLIVIIFRFLIISHYSENVDITFPFKVILHIVLNSLIF